MERFNLYRVDETTYVCKDDNTGIVCTFEKYKFNETQSFKFEGKMPDLTSIVKATREMSDWLAINFYNVVLPMNHKARIGSEIKAMRVEMGWSQAELGEMSGLHQTHIARLEAGRYSSSIDTLQAVAGAMGVQLSFRPITEDDDGEIGLDVPMLRNNVKS